MPPFSDICDILSFTTYVCGGVQFAQIKEYLSKRVDADHQDAKGYKITSREFAIYEYTVRSSEQMA